MMLQDPSFLGILSRIEQDPENSLFWSVTSASATENKGPHGSTGSEAGTGEKYSKTLKNTQIYSNILKYQGFVLCTFKIKENTLCT